MCTLVGIGYMRFNGTGSGTESHLVKRSADEVTPSIIHIETGYIIDNSNKEEKLYFEGVKETRDFVKYQYPSEKFVPLDELVTVCKCIFIFHFFTICLFHFNFIQFC